VRTVATRTLGERWSMGLKSGRGPWRVRTVTTGTAGDRRRMEEGMGERCGLSRLFAVSRTSVVARKR